MSALPKIHIVSAAHQGSTLCELAVVGVAAGCIISETRFRGAHTRGETFASPVCHTCVRKCLSAHG